MEFVWYLDMVGFKKLKSFTFFFSNYSWKTVKSSTNRLFFNYLIIWFNQKNQKLNFGLFLIINIWKCMHDVNAQWCLYSELYTDMYIPKQTQLQYIYIYIYIYIEIKRERESVGREGEAEEHITYLGGYFSLRLFGDNFVTPKDRLERSSFFIAVFKTANPYSRLCYLSAWPNLTTI